VFCCILKAAVSLKWQHLPQQLPVANAMGHWAPSCWLGLGKLWNLTASDKPLLLFQFQPLVVMLLRGGEQRVATLLQLRQLPHVPRILTFGGGPQKLANIRADT